MNDEAKTNTQEQLTEEKTFTQEQVNNIIGERLAKERTKNESALAEKEKELTQRENRLIIKEKIHDAGLPSEIIDAINLSDLDAAEKAIGIMQTVINERAKAPLNIKGVIPAGASPAGNNERMENYESLREAMGLSRR